MAFKRISATKCKNKLNPARQRNNMQTHLTVHTFTYRQTGHYHTGRMQNTSATGMPHYYVYDIFLLFVLMLSMYTTNL